MDKRTYVVTMGYGGCICKNFDENAPEETVNDILFSKPLNVAEFEGHPDFYTEKDLAKARGEGQAEAWDLARKMVMLSHHGGYTPSQLAEIFGSPNVATNFNNYNSFAEAQACVEAHARRFQIGDIIEYERSKERRVIVNKDQYGYYTLAKCGRVYVLGPRLEGWRKTGKNVDISYIMDELMED